MVTIQQLMQAMMSLNRELVNSPVHVVEEINVIERGEYEGGLSLITRAVIGVAIGKHGLIVFVDKNENTKLEQIMPSCPPGFTTGDADIDKRLRDDSPESGEDWKKC